MLLRQSSEVDDVFASLRADSKSDEELSALVLNDYIASKRMAPPLMSALVANLSGEKGGMLKVPCLRLCSQTLANPQATSIGSMLIANPSISSLDLSCNVIGPEGAACVAKAIEELANLKHLNLSFNCIGPVGVAHLADALIASKTQHFELDISGNAIALAGAQALAMVLKVPLKLRVLELSNNHVGTSASGFIFEALGTSGLEVLGMSANCIGDDGCTLLADSLCSNASLQILELQNNRIGDVGSQQLGAALEENAVLRQVDLSRNSMSDAGFEALIQCAKAGASCLSHINLNSCGMGRESAKTLATVLKSSTAIRHLNISNNRLCNHGLSYDGIAELFMALGRKVL